jgi:hypothetical protein
MWSEESQSFDWGERGESPQIKEIRHSLLFSAVDHFSSMKLVNTRRGMLALSTAIGDCKDPPFSKEALEFIDTSMLKIVSVFAGKA